MLQDTHKTRRDRIYTGMNLDETHIWTRLYLVEFYGIIRKRSHNLDELMYDDYDLDYTYSGNDYADLDEHYALDAQDLDEDYARDTQDYNDLAYRHYA